MVAKLDPDTSGCHHRFTSPRALPQRLSIHRAPKAQPGTRTITLRHSPDHRSGRTSATERLPALARWAVGVSSGRHEHGSAPPSRSGRTTCLRRVDEARSRGTPYRCSDEQGTSKGCARSGTAHRPDESRSALRDSQCASRLTVRFETHSALRDSQCTSSLAVSLRISQPRTEGKPGAGASWKRAVPNGSGYFADSSKVSMTSPCRSIARPVIVSSSISSITK